MQKKKNYKGRKMIIEAFKNKIFPLKNPADYSNYVSEEVHQKVVQIFHQVVQIYQQVSAQEAVQILQKVVVVKMNNLMKNY